MWDKEKVFKTKIDIINMKRGILIVSLLFLVSLIPLIAASPNLEITGINTSPSLIDTDSTFRLFFNVKNTGTSVANGVSCKIELRYGFSIYADTLEKNIGTLFPDMGKSTSYDIHISENAVRGSHNIKITCNSNTGEWASREAIVEVGSKYGTLNIMNVTTEPSIMEPGQKAILHITLKNAADYLMNEINLKLNFSGVDIAPYGETAEKKISSISAGSIEKVSFGIITLPKIEGGIYKIPMSIDYKDVTTKSYSISNYVSVEVGSKPEIDASIESTTIYGSKTIGEITIKLVNRGLTDVKLLNIKLGKSNSDFNILSSESVYVGNLDSDDYETAEFKIKLLTNKKEINLPLALEFRDSSNNLYFLEKTVMLKILTASEAGKGNGSTWIIAIVVAIAIIAYLFYKKNHKKKHII